MRTKLIPLLMLLGAAAWAGADPVELADRAEYSRHDLRVTSLCVEGMVVVVAHSDVGKGGGLQMMQLMHEENGKMVPMTCPSGPEAGAPPAPGSPRDAKKESKKD